MKTTATTQLRNPLCFFIELLTSRPGSRAESLS